MRAFLTLVTLAIFFGCGGGSGAGPSAPVQSQPQLARIAVSLSRSTIDIGETVAAAAAGFDGAGIAIATGPLTWSSSATSVATVSTGGAVTGVAAGGATITVASGTISSSVTLTVSAAQAGASVTVTPEIGSVTRGGTLQMTAVLRNPSGAIVPAQVTAWESSLPGIATISAAGVVTGVESGTTIITAVVDGHPGAAAVTVTPVVTAAMRVTVFSPSADATLDDSVRVLASVSPRQQVARVVGTIGPRAFTLRLIPAGFAGEAWEAWVRISDLAAGVYRVVVTAYDLTGATASDSVSFKRELSDKGGTGTGPSGHKQVRPPASPIDSASPRRAPNPARPDTPVTRRGG